MERQMKRRKTFFILETIIVLAVFVTLVLYANKVCNPYNEKADRVERGLYSGEKIFDDIDVALFGGSHGCNGFNPHEIYMNYGLTAYNFSLSGEPIYITYYHLKEMYNMRKPRVVVLDLYYLGLKKKEFSHNEYIFDAVRCFRYSRNRLEMVMNTMENSGLRMRAMLPLTQYHSRFDSLTKQDFLRQPDTTNDYLLGSQYYFDRNAGEEISFEAWNDTEESGGINARNKEYLQKIIDLAKENGSEILLVDIPHNHDDSGAPDEWVENEYMVMNEAKQIAGKNGIKYLQYDDKIMKEINFVPEEDMFNKGHMNYWGSVKTSGYLGKWLLENYEFDMEVKEKDTWDMYMEEYKKTVKQELTKKNEAEP